MARTRLASGKYFTCHLCTASSNIMHISGGWRTVLWLVLQKTVPVNISGYKFQFAIFMDLPKQSEHTVMNYWGSQSEEKNGADQGWSNPILTLPLSLLKVVNHARRSPIGFYFGRKETKTRAKLPQRKESTLKFNEAVI